jgi:quinohemoprotein amine dehydrogenase
MRRFGWLFALALVPAALGGQQPPAPESRPPNPDAVDEGIPVTSDLVRQKCGSCHKSDDKGRMTRISYRRTTPEGWEETIKRMVSLNNVKLQPAEARDIVRYLADRHGLAPEESKPAAFEVERELVEYKYKADKDTEGTCSSCHSMGRVISQRRTKEEWELLVAMHRGYYPLSDFQAFRRLGPPPRDQAPPADGRPPDTRHPMEKAIAHLSTAFPLTTPEWAAWSATMRPPRLQGKWALSGQQPGKGPVFGQVVITAAGGADSSEYTSESTFTYARTGETVKRSGRAIVYTGYQWRGKSDQPAAAGAAGNAWREVLFVDRDWRRAEGRWFTGAYDEFGISVELERIGADPIVLGVANPMMRIGGSAQELRIYGANLPTSVQPSDLNFGPNVTVERIVSATPELLTVSASAASGATVGRRDVILNSATGHGTIAVYSAVDYVKVLPEAGLARVGGANFPKQFQQFEAVAYANGPDGKPNTKDDVELGPVDVAWSIEEYTATYDDDDKDFVGTIDPSTGLFTPNLDGPNPKRRHNTNNYGDVWVVATYQQPKPIKGRAHLLVTVPLYIKWDQAEVSR